MPLSHTGWTLLRIGFSLLLSKAACISRWLPNEWDPTAVFCLSHSWMLPAPSKSSDLASHIAVLVKAIWWESFPHKTAPLRSLSYIKNIPVFSSSSPSPLLAQREHFPTLLPQAFMIQTFFILWDHIPLVIISPAISKTFFERLFWHSTKELTIYLRKQTYKYIFLSSRSTFLWLLCLFVLLFTLMYKKNPSLYVFKLPSYLSSSF